MAFLPLRTLRWDRTPGRYTPVKTSGSSRANESLKAQKSWEASVCWNDRVIKIRGKKGEEVKVKVSSKAP